MGKWYESLTPQRHLGSRSLKRQHDKSFQEP
jgi:hypothetical protein